MWRQKKIIHPKKQWGDWKHRYRRSGVSLYVSSVLPHPSTDACEQALILRLCCHNVLVTEESPLRQLHTGWAGSTLQQCTGCRTWTKPLCSNIICALQRNSRIISMKWHYGTHFCKWVFKADRLEKPERLVARSQQGWRRTGSSFTSASFLPSFVHFMLWGFPFQPVSCQALPCPSSSFRL